MISSLLFFLLLKPAFHGNNHKKQLFERCKKGIIKILPVE